MRDIIKHRTFDTLRKVMIQLGLSHIEATIYSFLVLKKEPLTAREISEEIGYAYSSVVNALNHLMRYDLIEREKNGKCYSYRAVIDFIKIIINERKRIMKFLAEAKEALKGEESEYSELIKHFDDALKYLGKLDEEVR